MKSISFQEYRAIPAINASVLKCFVDDTQERYQQYLAEEEEKDHSVRYDPLRFGTLAHEALLEPDIFAARTVLSKDLNLRTKQGRADLAECVSLNSMGFMFYEEHQAITGMMKVLHSGDLMDVTEIVDSIDSGILKTERTYVSNDGGRKGRFDAVGRGMIVDYKTCNSCRPDLFIKQAINLHYDLQVAWYADLYPEFHLFAFIAQEKNPPYLCSCIRFDHSSRFIAEGRKKYEKALERYYSEDRMYNGLAVDGDTILPNWYGK